MNIIDEFMKEEKDLLEKNEEERIELEKKKDFDLHKDCVLDALDDFQVLLVRTQSETIRTRIIKANEKANIKEGDITFYKEGYIPAQGRNIYPITRPLEFSSLSVGLGVKFLKYIIDLCGNDALLEVRITQFWNKKEKRPGPVLFSFIGSEDWKKTEIWLAPRISELDKASL